MDLFTLSASLGLDITNFEGGVNAARRLLLQFAGAVVDFGQDVIETGMGFDKQMSAVQAVMGLTENTADNLATMNKLREFALEQARDSIFTSEEAATAYYYMGMAGWRAEQMVAGLPGIMALAAASGEDLKMTSDMVTDSLTAFGLGAGQAAHFADVLAVTATNANTDVARMQQTFKNLAPIAGALGYSIEDVALSVGLIANSGIKGSQAGTALRNIFTRIATNAGATKDDLGALQIVTDELGVSFYTAEGRARPWGEVLTDLRTAWNKLDPDKVDKVTAAFGEFSAESQSADEIMAEFTNDLDEWTTVWNGLTTAVDRENFVSQLEPQFAALGISMRDSNGQLREFSEVAKDARVKLGGLTDQEQIYFGKQIGSLRGMSGWLALMTASEADVRQLTDAIKDADGAAQAMADTRLGNLWGDIARFNAELDVLKIALYDDVKSPLRDLVQYATNGLKNVTNAIDENGLLGGIRQLGIEISNFSEEYKDEIRALGEAIVPILNEFLTSITPAFIQMATTLGAAFGKGLLQGIKDATIGNWESILFGDAGPGIGLPGAWEAKHWGIENIGIPLGDGIIEGTQQEINNQQADWTIPLVPVVDIDRIQDALDEAQAAGYTTVTVDGVEFSTEDTFFDIQSKLAEAGMVGGNAMAQNVYNSLDEASQGASVLLATDLANAGVDGGRGMADNVLSSISSQSSNITNTVYNSISDAGTDAGNSVANSIQNALSIKKFFVNVTGWVKTLFGVNRNASAMAAGRIYDTPTIFGYANGAYQVAGDVGPEAVVGVNSLQRMIASAVHSAVAEQEVVVPRDSGRDITIILEIDRQQFARTVYKANNEETQRVGLRMATGGIY